MDDIIAALQAVERNLKRHADRALNAGGSPFTNTLPTMDQKINRAEIYHAIGDACGRAALELKEKQRGQG